MANLGPELNRTDQTEEEFPCASRTNCAHASSSPGSVKHSPLSPASLLESGQLYRPLGHGEAMARYRMLTPLNEDHLC